MLSQFFSKTYWISLATLAGLFGLSLISYFFGMGWIILILIGIAAFGLTIYKLEYAIALAFLARRFDDMGFHFIDQPRRYFQNLTPHFLGSGNCVYFTLY